MSDVSVIIVSFNTKKITLKCIESVLKEGSNLKKEIIVVDNGSTDGSVSAIRRFQIKIIVNKDNFGFAKANNQGIRFANGKYILLLNSDTEVKAGAIKKLVDFAQKKTDAGVVVPRLLNSSGSNQPSVFRLPTVSRAIRQYWFAQKGILDKYSPSGDMVQEVESAVMAAFLITPQALEKVGYLNEEYFMYYEDLDFCRAVRKFGLKIYYLPSAKVVHHHGASGEKLADPQNQWRRLIPSSKVYHGVFKHYLLNFVIWSGQKIYQNDG